MRVFISWSGNRSRAVAELITGWIQCVVQEVQPWISSQDIERGSLWFTEIQDGLRDTTVGIICLTADNQTAPWILFEAGALARGISTNRVITVLIDLENGAVKSPLSQFNHAKPDKDGMWQLVKTVYRNVEDVKMTQQTLEAVFETFWPKFEEGFKTAVDNNPPKSEVPVRSNDDVLAEILENSRSTQRRLSILESNVEAVNRERLNDTAYLRATVPTPVVFNAGLYGARLAPLTTASGLGISVARSSQSPGTLGDVLGRGTVSTSTTTTTQPPK